MTNEKKQEFTRRISQANSTQMVVILYDMGLEYIADAVKAAADNDFDSYQIFIGRLQGCISELCFSLNYEYEIAQNLRSLYDFCVRRIAAAQVKRDASILDEVKRVLAPLRDAYEKVVPYNKGGSVMGNSETVYAGLTYGKGDINESLVSQSNRGFLA